MNENREKLINAARAIFAQEGFREASMDKITANAGLTRGALYHNFGDKKGLFSAVVEQLDSEMALRAKQVGAQIPNLWESLIAEGESYIKNALDPEVQRIVLLDGPAVLGDPSQWPSQNKCLESTRISIELLIDKGILEKVDPAVAAMYLNGAAMNAALWIAAHENPEEIISETLRTFRVLATGFLKK